MYEKQKDYTVMLIGVIGNGHVGQFMTASLQDAGYCVCLLDRGWKKSMKEINGRLDLVILTTTDDAIAPLSRSLFEVSHRFLSDDAVVCHVSGSTDLACFRNVGWENYGCIYPLQTFSKSRKVEAKKIPFFIDSSNEAVQKTLCTVAKRLSDTVYTLPSDSKKTLHLSAVLACNFTNHLWAMATDVLEQKEIPFSVLAPLIQETLDKALEMGAAAGQTGPAKRKDQNTMEGHQQLLESFPARWQEVYRLMSEDIQSNN